LHNGISKPCDLGEKFSSKGIKVFFDDGSILPSAEKLTDIWNKANLPDPTPFINDAVLQLKGYGFNNFNSASSGQDKGHQNQFNLLIESVKNGGESIIPISELVNTTLASFAAVESLKTGAWVIL
jgi:hypothetical protein